MIDLSTLCLCGGGLFLALLGAGIAYALWTVREGERAEIESSKDDG